MNGAWCKAIIMGKANLMHLHQLRNIAPSLSSSKGFFSISNHFISLQGLLSSSSLLSNSCSQRSFATIMNDGIEELFAKKRSLRSQIRKKLRDMSPTQRAEEDNAIQKTVLEAPWFKSTNSLCAYVSCDALREVDTSRILSRVLNNIAKVNGSQPAIKHFNHHRNYEDSYNAFSSEDNCAKNRKKLYLPRIEDRNSNMRMLCVSSYDDLIPNSMSILEPSLHDASGNQLEDLMQANEAVDLFILPGLAFDKSGRRLGRSGGYYDLYLKNYLELAKERKWKPPLLVALTYSIQLVDDGAIAVTSDDVPVDALVCPTGVISTSVDGGKLTVT